MSLPHFDTGSELPTNGGPDDGQVYPALFLRDWATSHSWGPRSVAWDQI